MNFVLCCTRHCLLNCGAVLTEPLWWLVVEALNHAFENTLYPLRQLMTPFHENSDNFYGDVGQVKVAIRQDSSPVESARLRQLAHQVCELILLLLICLLEFGYRHWLTYSILLCGCFDARTAAMFRIACFFRCFFLIARLQRMTLLAPAWIVTNRVCFCFTHRQLSPRMIMHPSRGLNHVNALVDSIFRSASFLTILLSFGTF